MQIIIESMTDYKELCTLLGILMAIKMTNDLVNVSSLITMVNKAVDNYTGVF